MMNAPPQTPPRRYNRSKLVPSSYVTPSKTKYGTPHRTGLTPSTRGRVNKSTHTTRRSYYRQGSSASKEYASSTTPYHTPSSTLSKIHKRQGGFSTPETSSKESSDLDYDRFIPSRKRLNMDLCRRALLTDPSNKESNSSLNSNSNSNDPSNPDVSPQPAAQPEETPIQKEFKRRMLSTLCNVPLDQLTEDSQPASMLPFSSSNTSLPSHSSSMGGSGRFGAEGAENIFSNPFEHDPLRQMKVGVLDDSMLDPITARMSVNQKIMRKVPSSPVRILDAPDIVDDYYLNLISWSKDNILAVALAQSVYLWNATTGEIQHLLTVEGANDYVTSVCWCLTPGHTKYIAVGTNMAVTHLFDGHALRKVRTLSGHSGRVSALGWNAATGWMTSGARDSLIINHDVRQANAIVNTFRGHEQEVCGLKWNDEGQTLASGGNENFLCLWDAHMSHQHNRHGARRVSLNNSDHLPRFTLRQHKAAVKALDWYPFHRGLLASGGGTADRTIKFWNTSSGVVLNSVDTGSQVCSVVWSRAHQRELCSSHGYSENQLILWKYPNMTKIKELKGHTARVLNMEMSPDGASVVSAAADETLRFWNVFQSPTSLQNSQGSELFMSTSLFNGERRAPVIR